MIRTPTTLAWLLELLPELLADWRVQLVFTINGVRSAYSNGLDLTLSSLGLPVIPWDQALTLQFDLAVCASHLGGIEALQAPLLIVPHGPGHSRLTSMPRSEPLDRTRKSGAPSSEQRVVYALPHESFLSSLPEGAEHHITGDPAFDMILASEGRRSEYRAALGVDERQLVLVSSTWGPSSLLGTDPELFETLLRVLPVDEYVVAAVLHPNVWIGHGEWQLRTWLQRSLNSGVRLIPYQRGWRPTVVAADIIVGDHGSVTFYAAAAGKRVWLRTHGGHEMIEESPARALGDLAPRLPRVSEARTAFERPNPLVDDGLGQQLRRRAFAHEGEASARMRALLYELIDLDEPRALVARSTATAPPVEWNTPHSFFVSVAEADGQKGRVRVERTPAEVGAPEVATERVLVSQDTEPRLDILESADLVVTTRTATDQEDARRQLNEALVRFTGAFAVCVHDQGARTWQILARDHGELLARETGPLDAPVGVIAAAALHRRGNEDITVSLGNHLFEVRLQRVSLL